MPIDPYHAVQQEIQTSLQNADQLLSSYRRIRNMARDDSEELTYAGNELKATLTTLEADLEDLEESVKIVESTGARTFGLGAAEVAKRRKYVGHVRKEIENMRTELSAANSGLRTQPQHGSTPTYPPSPHSTTPDDDQAAWAREEQQMMMRQQDQTMESISGTLNTLAQQANLMGQEIGEHNEMLDDLERNVDHTDNKLGGAMRRMRKLIRDGEEKGSGYCIIFLIVVLLALLLAVILI
ncbi:snare protein TLG1/Syntaxin [Macrolepiota fuliginosa MF-IS2]|uniref:Snare protein TLG1/Syntaxin n=1 Tax=Macrolepiota fuliginosa MF-IS2 TaxID=1400762 RepID=A0A9P6C3Y8_9AGAR|nr:snare protein TLG1/Syntaxin [Macrolepiota fuliginosa MF-IS2]